MDNITIDVGVHTALKVDLTDFDFTGITKVVMSIENRLNPGILIEREFTEALEHTVTITPAESFLLRNDAEYDFTSVTTDGKVFKISENGKITLRKGVGNAD